MVSAARASRGGDTPLPVRSAALVQQPPAYASPAPVMPSPPFLSSRLVAAQPVGAGQGSPGHSGGLGGASGALPLGCYPAHPWPALAGVLVRLWVVMLGAGQVVGWFSTAGRRQLQELAIGLSIGWGTVSSPLGGPFHHLEGDRFIRDNSANSQTFSAPEVALPTRWASARSRPRHLLGGAPDRPSALSETRLWPSSESPSGPRSRRQSAPPAPSRE